MRNKHIKESWYSEASGFFGPEYIEEYEGDINAVQTKKEIAFIRRVLDLPAGAKILDVPCGHGRHAIELALCGYELTGQDINSFFLKKAGVGAKVANVNISLVRGDMRHIPFQDTFDAAINMFSSFGYLEDDNEDLKFLLQIKKALKPGGKFILDVINREMVVGNYSARDTLNLSDGSILKIERGFDLVIGRNFEERTRIRPEAKKECRKVSMSMRMYTLTELISMFKRVGLQAICIYGGYDCEDLIFKSDRCILVAKK